MTRQEELTEAITISGDRKIAWILAQEAAVSYPAFACSYDGFVNDVFSEYANPSILRPPSVRQAIVDAAHYLMRSMWEAPRAAFRYTACPGSTVAAELNAQILEGIGYAWRLCEDEALKQALLAGLAACLTTPYHSTTPLAKR